MKKVLIPQDIASVGKQYLLDRGYRVTVGSGVTPEIIEAEGADADAVILRTSPFGADILHRLPNVRIVARHGVGYDNVDVTAAEDAGIWVTNTPMANADSVAETSLALILALAKNLRNVSRAMADGDFPYKNSHKGLDLAGKTIGILGFGKIGSRLAKKLSGLEVETIAYDPFVTHAEHATMVDRDELFRRSDFVCLHVLVTPETSGSVGAREFALMKPSAYLINLARGEVVVEPELIEALHSGEIGGAALDVYSQEPLPLDNPLFGLDNVLLTPHIASNTTETMDAMALHAAMEVDRVLSGQLPQWPVNRPALAGADR